MTKRTHTAGSAAILLMASALGSGLLALVRIKYVNYIFGAGVAQDAYRAAFKLPDLLSYFLAGAAASVSLVTVLNRFQVNGDDEGADRALSVILTTTVAVLGIGVLFAEVFARQYVLFAFEGFRHDAARADLCTSLTRLILPAQLFFLIGGLMAARLQVRKIFLYQAFTPLFYNGSIILCAIFLHARLGIYSLAVGVLLGTLLGSALLNSFGALHTGLRFRPIISFSDPVFRDWLRLSLPLMVGVSLVMFDSYFLSYFGSTDPGGITLIGNAKDLFNAPFNVIGPAAGAASLPFFAALFQQGRAAEFSQSVTRAVSRLFAVGMLVSALMIALAPWLMDLFRGGKFNHADAADTTQLFIVLAVTLAIWAVQGIYARAFYAANDTMTPAVTGTIITIVSIPLYWSLFHAYGLRGLAYASDIGILIQTLTLAVLLQRKRLVFFADLELPELARALAAAIVAYLATAFAARYLPAATTHRADLLTLTVGTTLWAVVALLILVLTNSTLPAKILRRHKV